MKYKVLGILIVVIVLSISGCQAPVQEIPEEPVQEITQEKKEIEVVESTDISVNDEGKKRIEGPFNDMIAPDFTLADAEGIETTLSDLKGNSVALREVIALEMKDEAGGLDELLVKISRAGIHVENAYSRLISENKMAILVLEVPDVLEATRRLEVNGIRILDDKIVYGK